jgi:tetratricopeptide (TPR) repeat protein
LPGSAVAAPSGGPFARELLRLARERADRGLAEDAAGGYEAAMAAAERERDLATLAEALRLRAVLHHHRNEPERARALADRSRATAIEAGSSRLEAEALNVLGGLDIECGALDAARVVLLRALDRARTDYALWARIEQNLGIVANVRGDRQLARWHYLRSLGAYRRVQDRRGCAVALHNLGMLSADRARWRKADRQFERTRELAREAGDVHLEALALLNGAEVKLAVGQPDLAERRAEEALRLFEQLGSAMDLADAWKALGLVSRRLGRPGAAEARLRTAVELAAATGNLLTQAEAMLALADVHLDAGRRRDAVAALSAAWRLFAALGAKPELTQTLERLHALEEEYVASLEDALAFVAPGARGRAARMAAYAAHLAQALGLDAVDLVAARIAAYLTVAERGGQDCPWQVEDVAGRVRSRPAGDLAFGPHEPVLVHLLGLASLYDELTEPNGIAPPLPPRSAIERIGAIGAALSPLVMEAFARTAPQFVAA